MANYEKENIFYFLKKLSTDISVCLGEMKSDFDKNTSTTNIKERFLKWKSRYAEIVNLNLKECLFSREKSIDPNLFDFKDFLQQVTEEYQNDNEFLDLLKNVNQEIEALKDFIRSHLARDSSIYYVKEI